MNLLETVEMPDRIARLPRDRRGYPVPWFVAWIDGEPEFRVVAPDRVGDAVRTHRCWICGGSLGRYRAYVIGPMCAVNRNSAEPPSHRDCALYAARVCPFLTRPHMRRRENNLPGEAVEPPGTMLRRNPGVAAVWVTKGTLLRRDPDGGLLFNIGEPTETLWFAEGREATRAEVEASIESGLPALREAAAEEGPRALRALARMAEHAERYLPRAA